MTKILTALQTLELAPFLALNNRHSVELSALNAPEFARLVHCAYAASATEHPLSFLLAFDETASYASPNYLWFRTRHARFVYVDRVVVDRDGRGQGIAGLHYTALFAAALSAGHTVICAEVNADPPNPSSDAFHERLGFVEVGTAVLQDRAKTVRYLERHLTSTA